MSSDSTHLLRRLPVSTLLAALLTYSPLLMAAKIAGEPGSIVATPPDMTYYTLQGDTLTGIAKRFTNQSRNWEVLSKRNQIADDRAIPIGTAIRIPANLLPEEASEARVVALAGNPTYTAADGIETTLAIGTVVKEGSKIATGKNGFLTLAFPDESRVSIPSNSKVSLSKLRKTKYIASPRTEISLSEGKVESRVTSLASNKGRFEVRSPLAVAGVRGTHFRVGINADGTANEVLEGGVAVGTGNKKTNELILPAGKGNIVGANGVGKAVDLLPPPVLEAGYAIQTRPTVQFIAQKSAVTAAYRVQIARDAQALDVLAENRFKENRFKFDGLEDGQYFVRLTAIDALGLEGLPLTTAFTLKARPEPPFSIQPKNKVRVASVDFTWTEAAHAYAYHLQVAKDAGFKNIILDQADIKDVQFSGTLPQGEYFWRIATVIQKNGQFDQGPYGDIQSFQKLPPQAAASFSDSQSKQISFNWTAEPGQKFLIQIALDAEFKRLYLSQESDQAELKIPRPTAGEYYIRVRATDADGYVGAFSATQKITVQSRWTTSDGEAVQSGSGAVRSGF